MNIVQAYIKKYNKFFIVITGLHGSGKSYIAKQLAISFKANNVSIKLLNLEDFRFEDKKIPTKKIGRDININDSGDLTLFDWTELNSIINKYINDGVILYGEIIPSVQLVNKPDVTMHVKISKQGLVENRKKYIEKYDKEFNEEEELKIINKIVYPRYLKYLEEENINKYLNANKSEKDKLCDEAFDYIMNFVQHKLI